MNDGMRSGVVVDVDLAPTGSGVLDGVRIGVKEIVAIDGRGLSANTPLDLPSAVADPGGDAWLVAALRGAGGRVVAVTTSHELAWGITTYARGRNVAHPWLPDRIAGGSSGGSAAAVAQCTIDLGVATDTAGSARIPAAWCDVFGWKASDGLVPLDGVLPLAPGLDHAGLIARSATVLEAGATALGAPPSAIDAFHVVTPDGVDQLAVEAIDEAVAALSDAGLARVPDPVTNASLFGADVDDLFAVVQGAAALHAHRDLLETWPAQRDRYAPEIVARLEAAEGRTSEVIERAHRAQAQLRRSLVGTLDRRVVVLPTTGCRPPSVAAPDTATVDGQERPLRSVVLRWTVPANLAGLPSVSVPWSIDGEPVGVQLLGGPGTDRALIALAGQIARSRH